MKINHNQFILKILNLSQIKIELLINIYIKIIFKFIIYYIKK
jgi:hypothetical protein